MARSATAQDLSCTHDCLPVSAPMLGPDRSRYQVDRRPEWVELVKGGLLLLSSLLSRYAGFQDYAAVAINARL